jgi:MFS family permease
MAIITSVFPARERGLPLGLNTASVYIGLTIAPLLGGLVTEAFGWRSVFLLPAPFAGALLIMIYFFLRMDWRAQKRTRFDWVGTCIFAAWTLSLVVGLTGLPDLPNVISLIVAAMLLLLFVRQQSSSPQPLIRMALFTESRLFSLSLASASLMYAATYPLNFVMSLYLQYIRGLSPLESGQLIMVQAIAMALLAPFSGKLSDSVQPRIISTLGCIGVAVGFILLSQLDFDTATTYVSASLCCIGIGFGLFSAPNNNALMSSVPHNDIGVAAATISLARVSGNLVGISLINLLVHLLLGSAQITEENYPQLLATIRYALSLAAVFVIVAMTLSASRGRVETPSA